MDFVLGVHSGINASAALCQLSRAGSIYALQEERLVGEKNFTGFPDRAIKECLNLVDRFGGRIVLAAHASQVIQSEHLPRGFLQSLMSGFGSRKFDDETNRLRAESTERERHLAGGIFSDRLKTLGLDAPAVIFDHHATHAATAAYGLEGGLDEGAMVVTCDGAGDGLCASVWLVRNGELTKVAETPESASIGLLYMWTTFEYGFRPQEDEYKLMGMAPYVRPTDAESTARIFRDFLCVANDFSGFQDLQGDIQVQFPKIRERLGRTRFDFVFGGLQLFLEESLVHWITGLVELYHPTSVTAAGGVFMNVKANMAIQNALNVPFHAFPSCGDESLSLGAAFSAARQLGFTGSSQCRV